ncbi:YjbH domain-containing protein [Pseudomonas nitroreducens]|uniref:YjbH domain-containing protein n=1 Tax=Pseudomonas nitroreducens TaxID=46680 RepID=UPI001FB74D74|nr:YjbH domain-containing protein [Pseudomonas nitroreducens]MCJ1879751.1 YjbH domain-containing protein [Pseudomonas nitroreducens]MCJ1896912.1 YjbH domain-containing protein [Pseudomonas nitroreducens]
MRRHSLYLLLAGASLAGADPRYTQNDFGGVGLLQTPTARMAPAGEISVNANRTDPYSRYSFSLQPFDWMEGTFRYTSISNRKYGPDDLSGDQSYKDKAFDVKFRLVQEDRWTPEIAMGGRDIGGTGLFSSEYLVGNKRVGNLDFSLGVAWGYIGNRGDWSNPLGWVDNRFNTRPRSESTGEFSSNSYFRGRPSPFGGINWQTPWQPLSIKLEYDGNDYQHEPQNNNQKQSSPFNIGVVYKASDAIDLQAAFERGNTAMFGITVHTNFSTRQAPAKISDPAPEPLAEPKGQPQGTTDWADVSRRLDENAGYKVERIAQKDHELVVYGEQTRYLYPPEAVGRASRILDNSADDDVQWFTVIDTRYGQPVVETSVPRKVFRDVATQERPLEDLRRTTEQNTPLPQQEEVVYQQQPEAFGYNIGLGYNQSIGGPDNFLLYQFTADLDSEYRFTPSLWANGLLSANLINNYDNFRYDAPSGLPRVRTDIRQYMTTSGVVLPTFQLNKTARLDQDLYGMVYGGYLESMYAGIGGELLYRPMNQDWAVGANLDLVRQRDFDQHFGLRDYQTATGFVTLYWQTGFEDILAQVSAGRYLARDWGSTLDLSRQFRNGVRFGAWVTLTTANKEAYGEGSFDKGIYVSIPFDELMSSSTMRRANLSWDPLTRDGGARLNHYYSLYDLTEGRDPVMFQNLFGRIVK